MFNQSKKNLSKLSTVNIVYTIIVCVVFEPIVLGSLILAQVVGNNKGLVAFGCICKPLYKSLNL